MTGIDSGSVSVKDISKSKEGVIEEKIHFHLSLILKQHLNQKRKI